MARQVIWTPQAREEYRDIVSYLLDAFGDVIAEKFTDRLAQVLASIEAMPSMGRTHPILRSIQQVVVRPYTVVFYIVLPDEIIIVNLLDSRRG